MSVTPTSGHRHSVGGQGGMVEQNLAPGTQEWDDHFQRWSGWHIVKVNPTVKRLHELVSRYSTRTCFLLAPGTYYGPIVVKGTTSCLIRAEATPTGNHSVHAQTGSSGYGEDKGVTIECESEHYPSVTIDAPNAAVQIQGIKMISKGQTSALHLKQGAVQVVDCTLGSRGGETVAVGCSATFRRCKVSSAVANPLLLGIARGSLNRNLVVETGAGENNTGIVPKSVGVAVSAKSAVVSVGLVDSLLEGFETGLMVDGGARYRVDDCLVQGMGAAGVVAGGSSNGTIRNTSIQDNYTHGLVVEAEARVWVYQCTLTGNGMCGALFCDGSQPSLVECLLEKNRGVRQIDLYGSTATTLKANTIVVQPLLAQGEDLDPTSSAPSSPSTEEPKSPGTCGGRLGTFSLGVALNDVSDAVIENNVFRIVLPSPAAKTRGSASFAKKGEADTQAEAPSSASDATTIGCRGAAGIKSTIVDEDDFIQDDDDEAPQVGDEPLVDKQSKRHSQVQFKATQGDADDHHQHREAGPGASLYSADLFANGQACIVADGSSTSLVRGNQFKLQGGGLPNSNTAAAAGGGGRPGSGGRGGRPQSARSRSTSPSSSGQAMPPTVFGVMLGLWQTPRLEGNTFDGFRPDRQVYRFDASAATGRDSWEHPTQVTTWKTRSKRRGGRSPRPNPIRRRSSAAQQQDLASTPDVAPGVAIKLSSLYREAHGASSETPDSQVASTPNPPPTTNQQGKRQQGGSRPTSARSAGRSASRNSDHNTTIPILKDDHDGEVKELKGEIERLKARLRLRSTGGDDDDGSTQKRRPQSARPYRGGGDPQGSQRQPPQPVSSSSSSRTQHRSTTSTSVGPGGGGRSSANSSTHKIIGRYSWDLSKMDDFNKMRIPLNEIRCEVNPEGHGAAHDADGKPASIPGRLHDSWLYNRKQKKHEVEAAAAMAKGMEKKLEREEQQVQVTHLHDEQVKRFEEGRQKLKERLLPEPKKTRLTFDQHMAINDRAAKHKEYRKNLKEKLFKKHITANDERKYAHKPQSAIDAYSTSLYTSHRNKDLVSKAAEEMGVPLLVLRDRPPAPAPPPKPTRDGFIPRPPPSAKSKREVDAYCASLYRSHKDYSLAMEADAVVSYAEGLTRAKEEGAGVSPQAQRGRSIHASLSQVAVKAQRRGDSP